MTNLANLRTVFDNLPDPPVLSAANIAEYRRGLRDFEACLRACKFTESELDELCGMATMHPDPWVRHTVLQHLANLAPDNQRVREAIAWLTHDSEDFIAFEAIRAAGQFRVQEALRDLFVIVGKASERLAYRAGKPVGVGHALVLNAIAQILGTRDPAVLAETESRLFEGVQTLPPVFELSGTALPKGKGEHDHKGMQFVPPGQVTLGIPEALRRSRLVFDWTDVEQPRAVPTHSFWMDRYQVSTAEYDQFAQSEAARRHLYCHPSEPPGKLHVRNTILDPRFGDLHPATGVDWFDAYAYASWIGKRLPSESEWQWAAQGGDGRAYPWGNAFESPRVRWIGSVIGWDPTNLEVWRQKLLSVSKDSKVALTVPVNALDNMSPFGIVGMSGNAWEWTATNYFSHTDLVPEVAERETFDVIYDWRSYAVIRGGTWSSLPELTSVAFRGKDLLTDRHYEIGFRCVCDCAGPER